MSRLDPFGFVFGEVADDWFESIHDEAAAGEHDDSDRSQFAALPRVHDAIAQLEAPDTLERPPAVGGEYLTLLFVAYSYWRSGCRLLAPTRSRLEAVIAGELTRHPIRPPALTCYVQLPEQMFWSQVGDDMPHEPVDGLFVAPGRGGEELTVLAVLGLRQDRSGFSQISLTASLEDFSAASAMLRAPLFAPRMDGGAQVGFRSVSSHAELLTLTQLALELAEE